MSLELMGLTKYYTQTQVGLAPLNLSIQDSEWVSLLGPSGCGKTTLLKLVAGLETPSSGRLNSTFHRSEISYVFQDAALLPWLTVEENILLPLKLRSEDHATALDEANPWIEKLKLNRFRKSYPSQLSGGLKMRVSIARALITRPKLILLDEPFAALDEPIRIELGLEFRELWKTLRPTILFVTHSITEALWLSDRVMVFQGQPGKVILDRELKWGEDRPLSLRGSSTFQSHVEECFQLLRGSS